MVTSRVGESDKLIKISGKVEKSNTYNGFTGDISFFIQFAEVLQWMKNEILPVNPL